MGMFDSFVITEEVSMKFGVPEGEYQTKDLNCNLDVYTITNDNLVMISTLNPPQYGWSYNYPEFKNPCIMGNGKINIYTNRGNSWIDYDIIIEEGIVINIQKYFRTKPNLNSKVKDLDIDAVDWVPTCYLEFKEGIEEILKKYPLETTTISEYRMIIRGVMFMSLVKNNISDVDVDVEIRVFTSDKKPNTHTMVYKFVKYIKESPRGIKYTQPLVLGALNK